MKITASQLRRIIREEVSRSVLREALDPAQLADMTEEEVFKTMAKVAGDFARVAEQASRAMKGMSAEGDPARVAEGLKVHMEMVNYAMEGLQMCVDALNDKMGEAV